MRSFTTPDRRLISLVPAHIIRARSVIYGESPNGKTRIDWSGGFQFVMEPIEQVGPDIAAQMPSFVQFTSPSGTKSWFNAAKAIGPLPVYSIGGMIQSSFKIMGYTQFVQEDEETVRKIIREAGGTVL